MGRKLSAAERREENWGWLMVAPTIIGLAILNLWPFVQTIYASFLAVSVFTIFCIFCRAVSKGWEPA